MNNEEIIEKVTQLKHYPKVERLTDEQKKYITWMFKKALSLKDKIQDEKVKKLKEQFYVGKEFENKSRFSQLEIEHEIDKVFALQDNEEGGKN